MITRSAAVGPPGAGQDRDGAAAANEKAAAWTKERLGPLVDSPLEARAGEVLVEHRP